MGVSVTVETKLGIISLFSLHYIKVTPPPCCESGYSVSIPFEIGVVMTCDVTIRPTKVTCHLFTGSVRLSAGLNLFPAGCGGWKLRNFSFREYIVCIFFVIALYKLSLCVQEQPLKLGSCQVVFRLHLSLSKNKKYK